MEQKSLDIILDDRTLMMLTGDVIRARGFEPTNLDAIWRLACQLFESGSMAQLNSVVPVDNEASLIEIEAAVQWSQTNQVLAAYFIRDAKELIKFLYYSGFIFPDE